MIARAAAMMLAVAGVAALPALANTCVGLGELAVVGLPTLSARDNANVRRTLDFTKTAQCLDDGFGQRETLLVGIAGDNPTQVNIAALADRKKGLMPLIVQVLDSDRHVISRHGAADFVQRGMRHTLSLRLSGLSKERFLLIEVDRERVGTSGGSLVSGVRLTAIVMTPVLIGSYSNGTEQTIQMPFVGTGKLEVEIMRVGSALP